ncbi:MAG: hypothetical protein AAFO62_00730 [Pseudomonadota bacterium]
MQGTYTKTVRRGRHLVTNRNWQGLNVADPVLSGMANVVQAQDVIGPARGQTPQLGHLETARDCDADVGGP